MRITPGIPLLLLTLAVQSSFASVILVTSISALNDSDSLVIGSSIGGDGTTKANGFAANTTNSNTVTFTDTGADGFTVLQESVDWSGNFANNTPVLWTTGDSVPVTMSFGTAVGGVGMQIESDFYGPFTASITAFDASNNNLGSFTEMGLTNTNNDNSAIFLGVLSNSANIRSIEIDIAVPSDTDYAFGGLTFGSPAPIPEPSSLALFLCGAGLFPVIVLRRRRQS